MEGRDGRGDGRERAEFEMCPDRIGRASEWRTPNFFVRTSICPRRRRRRRAQAALFAAFAFAAAALVAHAPPLPVHSWRARTSFGLLFAFCLSPFLSIDTAPPSVATFLVLFVRVSLYKPPHTRLSSSCRASAHPAPSFLIHIYIDI
ncbi:uncharacterized protein FOMMEDRAFT_150907 [Fomitiporia mediterranea MF3/22]|uniref:uncharacterized protein n=1 Tax=Fomitiporia mediterranea (strain MF3/22) TaxID=694068 RepID=UPI0004407DBB|nr:uncharacterized protein FOMMEDRAFT_150907 [Fomitiporia mediterranea MF3/22]EJD08199.1 hypothetical protein FOMMEDRAFT_150907 [Fomitiporia mediterranea MF3/22]